MNKKIKALSLVLCAVLLVVVSVVGTLAYLTSQTKVVKNTFTAGNVVITLDEAPVDEDGQATDGTRVTENSYKLMPGHEYDKDPTIHVGANSEDCWLFVKITDEIAAIQDGTTIADQLEANGWMVLDADNYPGVYYYNGIVSKGANKVVFRSFKIKGDLTNDELAEYADKTITVQAYAVQADGFATAAAAWAAAPCTWDATN